MKFWQLDGLQPVLRDDRQLWIYIDILFDEEPDWLDMVGRIFHCINLSLEQIDQRL